MSEYRQNCWNNSLLLNTFNIFFNWTFSFKMHNFIFFTMIFFSIDQLFVYFYTQTLHVSAVMSFVNSYCIYILNNIFSERNMNKSVSAYLNKDSLSDVSSSSFGCSDTKIFGNDFCLIIHSILCHIFKLKSKKLCFSHEFFWVPRFK